ncbi:MAG: hypothetical protein QXM94_02500, partial [Thermoplasmata archaeon]
MNSISEKDLKLICYFGMFSQYIKNYFDIHEKDSDGLFFNRLRSNSNIEYPDVIDSRDIIIDYITSWGVYYSLRDEIEHSNRLDENITAEREFLNKFVSSERIYDLINAEEQKQYVEFFENIEDMDQFVNKVRSWSIYKKLIVFAYLSAYMNKYSKAEYSYSNNMVTVEHVANLLNRHFLNHGISNYEKLRIRTKHLNEYSVIIMDKTVNKKRKRLVKVKYQRPVCNSAIYSHSITCDFLPYRPKNPEEEKAIKHYLALYLAQCYMEPTIKRWKNMIRQVLLIMDVVMDFDPEGKDSIETTSGSTSESGNFHYNPINDANSYSHHTVSLPIMADLLGIELEYDGNVDKISNFGNEFEYLRENGWVIERDNSVTFELKSPLLTLEEVNNVSNKCKNLFDAWSANTDKNLSGLHVHVSMDREFIVGKQPTTKTSIFLTRLVQEIESNLFQTPEQREKIFKRNFNGFARSSLGQEYLNDSRYYWLNLEPLYRNYGKTIEVRLGSATLANQMNIYAEKAYMIVKLIKLALKNWRANNRQDYTEWRTSLNGKLLKALLPSNDLARFIELFK